MSSTYTRNVNIEKPGTGEQAGTWGMTANANYDTIDAAIDGFINITLSPPQTTQGAPMPLDATQIYRTISISGTQGATGYVQINPATAQRLYFVRNQTLDSGGASTGHPLIFQQQQSPGTTGTTFSLDAGHDAILYADGAGNPGNVAGALDNPQFNNVLIKGSLSVTGSQAQTSISLDTTDVTDTTKIRRILYTTSNSIRWEIQATTGPSETDSNNPASDLKILAYDTSGNLSTNGSVIYINRASGNVVIGPGASIPGYVTPPGQSPPLGNARLSVVASTQANALDQPSLNVVGRGGANPQTSAILLVQRFDPGAASGTNPYTNLFAVDIIGDLRVYNDMQMWKNGHAQTGWSGTITGAGLNMVFVGGVLVSA